MNTFAGFDAETLARFQFAFTVSFHIIFPAFSIGLASYLAVLNGLWLWRKDDTYLKLFDYWKKIFAVAFGTDLVPTRLHPGNVHIDGFFVNNRRNRIKKGQGIFTSRSTNAFR